MCFSKHRMACNLVGSWKDGLSTSVTSQPALLTFQQLANCVFYKLSVCIPSGLTKAASRKIACLMERNMPGLRSGIDMTWVANLISNRPGMGLRLPLTEHHMPVFPWRIPGRKGPELGEALEPAGIGWISDWTPMSVPCPIAPIPAAVAVALPEEPPGVIPELWGLIVWLHWFRVNQRSENAGVFVRPMMTAPALRKLVTTGLSWLQSILLYNFKPFVLSCLINVDFNRNRHTSHFSWIFTTINCLSPTQQIVGHPQGFQWQPHLVFRWPFASDQTQIWRPQLQTLGEILPILRFQPHFFAIILPSSSPEMFAKNFL